MDIRVTSIAVLGLLAVSSAAAAAKFCDVQRHCFVVTNKKTNKQCSGEQRRQYRVVPTHENGCPKYFTFSYHDYEGNESRNIQDSAETFDTCGPAKGITARQICPPKKAAKRSSDGDSLPGGELIGRKVSFSGRSCTQDIYIRNGKGKKNCIPFSNNMTFTSDALNTQKLYTSPLPGGGSCSISETNKSTNNRFRYYSTSQCGTFQSEFYYQIDFPTPDTCVYSSKGQTNFTQAGDLAKGTNFVEAMKCKVL